MDRSDKNSKNTKTNKKLQAKNFDLTKKLKFFFSKKHIYGSTKCGPFCNKLSFEEFVFLIKKEKIGVLLEEPYLVFSPRSKRSKSAMQSFALLCIADLAL
jgi:hypothetical protein